MKENIVIVIPAYNEEKSIGKTLDSTIGQSVLPAAIIVVNNNSTDRTVEIVNKYKNLHNIIHLIHEPRKGTGTACRTGFRYAIDKCGATIICRTDADTIPSVKWVEVIADYFHVHNNKQFITGPCRPNKDDNCYKLYDSVAWPIFWKMFLTSGAIVRHSLFFLRFAFGHNLAIRKQAYEAVGGFTHGAIDEWDEDLELNKTISNHYGFKAMGYVKDMIVFTSMRRVRTVGYFGLITYYVFPNKNRRLKKTKGIIDLR